MKRLRTVSPVIVEVGKGCQLLRRIPRVHDRFDEAYLQDLLKDHPDLLPVSAFRDDVGSLVCVGREVFVGTSGVIDNLYLSSGGYPVVVETKLWRNPEARREVLAQIIGYIKDLRRKSYEWFDAESARFLKSEGKEHSSLFNRVAEVAIDEVDEGEFIDRLHRALARGEILGMIVGDGIETRLQELVDDVCRHTSHLHYSLALVELGCYEHEVLGQSRLLVVPRVVQSVEPIGRTFIRVEFADELKGKIEVHSVSEPVTTTKSITRAPLTEERFLQSVADAAGNECMEAMRGFYQGLAKSLELEVEWKEAAAMLKVPDPELDRNGVSLLGLSKDGRLYNTRHLPNQLRRWGVSEEEVARLSRNFWTALNVIDARFDLTGLSHVSPARFVPFVDLMGKLPEVEKAVMTAAAQIREAAVNSAVSNVETA